MIMRVLLFDFRKARLAAALIDGGKTKRLDAHPTEGGAKLFVDAYGAFGLAKRKVDVIVSTSGAGGGWSMVRQATAFANTLAFAWGVPVAGIAVAQDDGDDEVARRAVRAAAKAAPLRWVQAEYDGDPNITSPKPMR
jgi:tRNA A37 threonylcarbamoyladenosine modification protein TsaB